MHFLGVFALIISMNCELINKKIHFIGVLGSSMSGLARYLSVRNKVSGSDISPNSTYYDLKKLGLDVYIGSDEQRVSVADIVVYNHAIKDTDPELLTAVRLGKKLLERGELLGMIAEDFDTVVAISGTHGKSTVTGMIGNVLRVAGKKPFVHLGGQTKESYPECDNKIMVVEACEYKESFKYIRADISVVLNIEPDHPDYYTSLSQLYDAFNGFLANRRPNGITVKPQDLPISGGDIMIGRDVTAVNAISNEGYYSFQPVIFDEVKDKICLSIPGVHNVYNALVTVAVCDRLGIDYPTIMRGIAGFGGIKRRFESVGKINGAEVIVDYAHHPTEIVASINTARTLCKGQITVVFQPHTYSRTAKLMQEFVSAFDGADVVIIVKEYPARERPEDGKSAYDLYSEIKKQKKIRIRYADSIESAGSILYRYCYHDDVLLILGAGDVVNIVNYS